MNSLQTIKYIHICLLNFTCKYESVSALPYPIFHVRQRFHLVVVGLFWIYATFLTINHSLSNCNIIDRYPFISSGFCFILVFNRPTIGSFPFGVYFKKALFNQMQLSISDPR